MPDRSVLFCWLLGLSPLLVAGLDSRADDPTPAIATLPEITELPNPFLFRSGSTVASPADWDRRRAELKTLFEEYEYGHLPPKPESIVVVRGAPTPGPIADSLTQTMEITLGQADRKLVLHASLTWPKEATGRLPVVVRPGAYPGARPATTGINRNAPVQVTRTYTPRNSTRVPIMGNPVVYRPRLRPATIETGFIKALGAALATDIPVYLARGIAVVEFNLIEVAADKKDQIATSGVYRLFDGKLDAGGLMAWAWGFHRIVDAIETDGRLDASKIIVTGHSRYGKAALVAGAFDERIALTVPNHSGAGGAAPYRFLFGKSEALHNIAGAFPYWFRPDFGRFIGQVSRLPVDQHELRALVAPRAVLVVEGTNDAWSNPEGSQLAHRAALAVYTFLGVPEKIAIRFRPVGHIVTSQDVAEYADHLWRGAPLADEFNKLPYPEAKDAFHWKAPEVKPAP